MKIDQTCVLISEKKIEISKLSSQGIFGRILQNLCANRLNILSNDLFLNKTLKKLLFTANTSIRGLSTLFKKRLKPSLSCQFLEDAGNWRNLISWFRRLETEEH